MVQVFTPSAETGSTQWNWLSLVGPDAQDFLHRLCTVHVKGLGVGEGAPGCFLTAQGKVRSYFTLWNYDSQAYAFEFDAGASGKWKQDLLNLIDQYTFGEKITLTDPGTKLESRWLFFKDEKMDSLLGTQNLQPGQTVAIDEEIRICHHGDSDFGRTWITVWGRPGRLAQWVEHHFAGAQTLTWEEVEKIRIQSLSPRMDAEINENTIPLEVGLKRSIAENKGCYPGQEVIERMISLGSPARRLVKILGQGPAPAAQDKIFNQAQPPVEVGTVTSVTSTDEGFVALGMIKKIHAKERLEVSFSGNMNTRGVITEISPYA